MKGLAVCLEVRCTVKVPLTATSLQQPLFFCPTGQKNPYIDSCLKLLYNGHLFFCS